jgi:hypothetical protein
MRDMQEMVGLMKRRRKKVPTDRSLNGVPCFPFCAILSEEKNTVVMHNDKDDFTGLPRLDTRVNRCREAQLVGIGRPGRVYTLSEVGVVKAERGRRGTVHSMWHSAVATTTPDIG